MSSGASKPAHPGIESDDRGMLPLNARPLFTLSGQVGPAVEIGATAAGRRTIFPVDGGEFSGDRLRGIVLAGGSDHMLVRSDGVAVQDVRLTLRTHDDQLIYMSYRGLRHGPSEVMERLAKGEPVAPSEYYFRIVPTFETGCRSYEWLQRIIVVGVGRRLPRGPVYDLYEIL